MKSLLALLAAAIAPCIALGQQAPSPAPAASPTPAGLPVPSAAPLASPSPAAGPASSPAAGNTHEAAATVPLPGQATGPNLEKSIPLIPETAPSNSRPSHTGRSHPGSTPHDTDTFQVEQDIRVRVRMREAETRALNDPAIQEDWAAAHHARTDPERRALLGVYYNHLFDLMIKLDPSIAQHANMRRQGAIARMRYTRLGDLTNAEDPFEPVVPDASGPNPPAAEPQAPPP